MLIFLNTSGWTQEKKNMIKAMAVSLLFKNGITYSNVQVTSEYNLNVDNPSSDPSAIINTAAIDAAYAEWKTASDAANAIERQRLLDRKLEIESNEFFNLSWKDIEAKIDAEVNNIATVKILLKKFIRYVIARING